MKMADISRQTRELFELIDRDGSGKISKKEFLYACNKFSDILDRASIDKTIAEADADGDGLVSLEEFAKVFGNLRTVITKSEAKSFFASFDIDCSGDITVAELQHMMSTLGYELTDQKMDMIFEIGDVDGNAKCEFPEFLKLLQALDFDIVNDDPETTPAPVSKAKVAPPTPPKPAVVPVDSPEVKTLLTDKIGCGDGNIDMNRLKRALELLEAEERHEAHPGDARLDPHLHWDPKRELRGLGEVLYKANHIALICSDIGRSAAFYTNVIGLQPIRRPNFDRFGAWFSMGNIELHLIKGTPTVYEGDDLVIGHISLETFDVERVPAMLRSLGVPFRKNVTVPGGDTEGDGTNVDPNNDGIVTQYFFRDPDGYYLEVCSCDELTEYCLGKKEDMPGYNDGVQPLTLNDAMRLSLIGLRMSKHANVSSFRVQKMMDDGYKGKPHAVIAKALGCVPAPKANKKMLDALIVRLTVYGDIVQNETEESLENILKLTGNDMKSVQEVMLIHGGDVVTIRPPAFYEGDGKVLVTPDSLQFDKKYDAPEIEQNVPYAAAAATAAPQKRKIGEL